MPSETNEVCMYQGEEIFSCQQCGDCCKGYGGTYISSADMRAIADHIGMAPEQFEKKFCDQSGGRLLLAQQENGFCVFWRDKMCGIHPVKPKMCREWPFIRSVFKEPSNWKKMASMCPGIREEVPPEVVKACVQSKLDDSDG